MVKTATQVRRIVKRYADALKQHIHVDKVILFGSYANGHPHEWRDIDVAIISPDFDGKGLFRRVGLLTKARQQCDDSIEALAYGRKEYEAAHRQTFLGEIICTGRIVYDAEREKTRRYASGAAYKQKQARTAASRAQD